MSCIVRIDYRQNRGLARTWNDIISFAYIENKYDHCVILNDDFAFVDTGFNDFIKFAHRNFACPIILSEWDYACFIYNQYALDTIGMFDENIYPITLSFHLDLSQSLES